MNEDKNYNDEKESMDDSAVFYENKKKKALIKSKFEINNVWRWWRIHQETLWIELVGS